MVIKGVNSPLSLGEGRCPQDRGVRTAPAKSHQNSISPYNIDLFFTRK